MKCPNCEAVHLKEWIELTDEEKMLVERLPASADFDREERKRHLYCTRCWFEMREPPVQA